MNDVKLYELKLNHAWYNGILVSQSAGGGGEPEFYASLVLVFFPKFRPLGDRASRPPLYLSTVDPTFLLFVSLDKHFDLIKTFKLAKDQKNIPGKCLFDKLYLIVCTDKSRYPVIPKKKTEQLGKLGGGRERKTRFQDLNFRGMEFYVKVIFCRVNEKISLEN